ncbi:phage baseplate protein [Citrobacter amalonaticus]|uniref:phage baseplate protein n=1 Tax=Citrobacter amalonaticus TaxID=35703 RepID=UPI0018B0BD98|nr:hypothetical protein [Citrobacter amalonaticus]
MNGALAAPQDSRAVLVLESGVTLSLRVKTGENIEASRTITRGKIETGYKISDGVVDDGKSIQLEGIITGSDSMLVPYDMSAAASIAQSIMQAFEAREFASCYTSMMAIPQCVIRRARVDAEPNKNAYNVRLEIEQVRTVTFQRSRINSAQAKTTDPAGKGKVSAGKKTSAKVDTKKDPQTATKAQETQKIYTFGTEQRA